MKPPKEKAIELLDKFHLINNLNNYEVKQCALIAVDEIMGIYYRLTNEFEYWKQVKTEIEKL